MLVICALAVIGLLLAGPALTASALDAWRSEAVRVRTLAENDAPRAYQQAQQLQATLPADATPADRAQALNLLARTEIYLAQTEPADQHARAALALATRNADKLGQAEANLNIATNAVNQAKIDALIAASTNSLTELDGVDRPDLLGEAMLRTAMMYRRIGQLDDSVTMTMQAMDIAKRNGHPLALAYAHQGLAISFDQSGHQQEAFEHFRLMRDQAQAAHSKLLEGYALIGMGRMTKHFGDLREGEAQIRASIKLFREVGTPTGLSYALFNLAEYIREQERHAESLPILNEVVAIYDRYPNKIGLWYTLNARSASQRALGNLAAAQADVEHAYALAKDIGLSTYLSESAQRLAAIHAARGDHRRAYALALEAWDMKAKTEREQSGERMMQLAKRYQTESKQQEINALNRRNQQQAVELRQHMLQQRWLWTVLGGSFVMLAGSALFLVRLRRSHRMLQTANLQLQRSQAEISALNTGLEQRVQARTAELRQQTSYLRTLIDMLPAWAWLKDTESRFLTVNRAVAEAVGQPADAMIGKSDLDFFPREIAESYRADDAEVMATRHKKIVEEPLADVHGNIWIETYTAAVLDEDGTVLGTVGLARNISERKAAEAAREAALAEAQRLAKLRSEFLAQMSHELRTPLNGILGYAQILLRSKNLDERQLAGLDVIQKSGEHLLTLINDILDLARIEASRMELYPVDIGLPRFLQVIGEMISVRAGQKKLEFVHETAADLPAAIHADEKRLRQVLLNLLSNAVKFTEHGRVSFRVSVTAPTKLRFEVQDTGVGIDAAQLETIFQPFEQTGSPQHRMGGTGLGLAISRQLVRLMGSDIHVTSELARGSTFWFELDVPVVQAELPPVYVESMIIGYEGPRRKILVVDDVAENRTVLVEMLGQLGFEVHEAENGDAGLDKVQSLHPDLVLLDIVMPGMDGLELTRRLREMPAFRDLPIIAVSASSSNIDAGNSQQSGINAFVSKPVDFRSLFPHIARLLQLTWIYEAPAATSQEPPPAELIAPPPEEMEILHSLALQGNMRDILQRLAHIDALDQRYRAFTQRLAALAKGYQSKALLNFVEQYVQRPQTP